MPLFSGTAAALSTDGTRQSEGEPGIMVWIRQEVEMIEAAEEQMRPCTPRT
jgi:hypothetical protein